MKKDYYAILGVSRDADAETIKRAYRRLALEYHPDRNPGNKEAEERFKEIAEAYEVLSDPEKRRQYDLFGTTAGAGGGMSAETIFSQAVEEILSNFFGGGGTRSRRSQAIPGGDIQVTIELTLEEIATGVKKEVEYLRDEICDSCGGSGSKAGRPPHPCPSCGGTGQIAYRVGGGFFQQIVYQTCPECQGTGMRILDPCPVCGGTGIKRKLHRQTVDIPPGATGGMTLALRGGGHRGPWGGPPGDLLIQILEHPHALFQRKGEDLIYEVWVAYPDLVLGTTIAIPVLGGETIPLRIPAGTASGEVFKLPSKGLPRYNSKKRGDLLVQVHVWVPNRVSIDEKRLLEEMRSYKSFQPTNRKPEKGFWQRIRQLFE